MRRDRSLTVAIALHYVHVESSYRIKQDRTERFNSKTARLSHRGDQQASSQRQQCTDPPTVGTY